MLKIKLWNAIESHQLWLETCGKYGKQADLSNLHFREINLKGANLSNAILTSTKFVRCNLNGSIFVNAQCSFSDFKQSQLVNSDFTNANLTGSNFVRANIKGAVFAKSQRSNCAFFIC